MKQVPHSRGKALLNNTSVAAILFVAAIGSQAKADIWSFANGTTLVGDFGTTKTFTSTGGVQITATG